MKVILTNVKSNRPWLMPMSNPILNGLLQKQMMQNLVPYQNLPKISETKGSYERTEVNNTCAA